MNKKYKYFNFSNLIRKYLLLIFIILFGFEAYAQEIVYCEPPIPKEYILNYALLGTWLQYKSDTLTTTPIDTLYFDSNNKWGYITQWSRNNLVNTWQVVESEKEYYITLLSKEIKNSEIRWYLIKNINGVLINIKQAIYYKDNTEPEFSYIYLTKLSNIDSLSESDIKYKLINPNIQEWFFSGQRNHFNTRTQALKFHGDSISKFQKIDDNEFVEYQGIYKLKGKEIYIKYYEVWTLKKDIFFNYIQGTCNSIPETNILKKNKIKIKEHHRIIYLTDKDLYLDKLNDKNEITEQLIFTNYR